MSVRVVLRGGERDGLVRVWDVRDDRRLFFDLASGVRPEEYLVTDEVVTLDDGSQARVAVHSAP